MKMRLTREAISKMSLRSRPVWEVKGGKPAIKWEKPGDGEPDFEPYFIWDDHRELTGFGVKVSRHSSSYVVQRRASGGSTKRTTLDKTSTISLDRARELAETESASLRKLGKSVRELSKERAEKVPTLRQVMADYEKSLRARSPKPAKASTLANVQQSLRRLEEWQWADLPLKSLTSKMILQRFDLEAAEKRSATEQTCRWAAIAVKHAIANEVERAQELEEEVAFSYNPFQTLYTHKRFWTRAAWQEKYESSGLRNPLDDTNIGPVLDVIWKRREIEDNRTACDYLLLTMLCGTRRGELANLRWDPDDFEEKIVKGKTTLEPVKRSAIYLGTRDVGDGARAPLIWLRDTKNRSDHKLPLVGAALEIIKERKRLTDQAAGERANKGLPPDPRAIWVFPARSYKAKDGHYKDSKAILAGIKKDTGMIELRTHDFRRTLASYADRLTDSSMVKRLLNHRALADATTAYSKIPWEDIVDALEKCHIAMLRNSPLVYNYFVPKVFPPIHETSRPNAGRNRRSPQAGR